MIYTVYSLDMWGHVPADCCAAYDCPCIGGDGEHDDNACECYEDMNDRFKLGTIDLPSDADDGHVIEALIAEGYLEEKARELAVIDDYACSDGSFGVLDSKGRAVLQVEA